MAIQDTRAQGNETQKELIAKLVNAQRHAGYQVWNKDGIASVRIREQSKDIVAAIKGQTAGLIKEENKDDAKEKKEKDLDKKRQREQAEEDRRKGGIFQGIGALLKTVALGADGKGEKGLFKGGLLGMGKGALGLGAGLIKILFNVLKFIGGPLLLFGTLAFLTADPKQQKEMIDSITSGLKKVFNYVEYLGGAFRDGFLGKDGLDKKFKNFQTAWGKALTSFDEISFGKNAKGEPYKGIAGIAEWLGGLAATISGLFLDVGTGVANLIADPNKFIGNLQGEIEALFDNLGALISDFWNEGLANPRNWRNILMSIDETGTLAKAAGLGMGGIQAGEAAKRQELVERAARIPGERKALEDAMKDKSGTYSSADRRFMQSEIVRLKAEEERTKVRIETLDNLRAMDNAEANLAQIKEEFILREGVNIKKIEEDVIEAEKQQRLFREGKMMDKFGVNEIVDTDALMFEGIKGKGDTGARDIMVDRGAVISYLQGMGIPESQLKKKSLGELLIMFRKTLKGKTSNVIAENIEDIFSGEGGSFRKADVNAPIFQSQLDKIIRRQTSEERGYEARVGSARIRLGEIIEQLGGEQGEQYLKLLRLTNPDIDIQAAKGLIQKIAPPLDNLQSNLGGTTYNMGGNVTDQSKKSVYMFPERHIFGEQRMQLVTG